MFDKQIDWLMKFDKRSLSYKEKREDIAGGLVMGLVGGLVGGLGSLISVSLIASIKYFPFKIWLLIVGVIVVAEFIFLILDKSKPKKKDSKFWFTTKRKGIAYLESAFIILEANGLYQLGKRGTPYIKQYFPEIVKWLGYIGITLIGIVIVVGVLYGYVWVNSLKYKK